MTAWPSRYTSVTFTTVDCSAKYTVVTTGGADAVAGYITSGTILLAALGVKPHYFSFADAGLFLPSHGIVTSLVLIKDNPDLVARFNDATMKSWEAAEQDPKAVIAAFISANPLQNGRSAQALQSLESGFQFMAIPATSGKPFGWQSLDALAKTKTLLVKYARMPATAVASSFYSSQFVPK